MLARNMGNLDRAIRAVVGILLLIAYTSVSGGWAWVLLVVGIVLLVTAALGSCPPYALLGINTCKKP